MKRIIIRSTAASMILFVGVVGFQFFNYSVQLGRASEAALAGWEKKNPAQSADVARYRAECLSSPASDPANKVPVRPELHGECAARIGTLALGAAVESANAAVPVPAPLRWL